jgi:hypothetical protein
MMPVLDGGDCDDGLSDDCLMTVVVMLSDRSTHPFPTESPQPSNCVFFWLESRVFAVRSEWETQSQLGKIPSNPKSISGETRGKGNNAENATAERIDPATFWFRLMRCAIAQLENAICGTLPGFLRQSPNYVFLAVQNAPCSFAANESSGQALSKLSMRFGVIGSQTVLNSLSGQRKVTVHSMRWIIRANLVSTEDNLLVHSHDSTFERKKIVLSTKRRVIDTHTVTHLHTYTHTAQCTLSHILSALDNPCEPVSVPSHD